jgi:hypothetical protein
LQIIDHQQHRRLVGETLDDRQEAGRDLTLIRRGTCRVGPQ